MDGYRLYFLDERDRIAQVLELEWDGDEAALSGAETYRDGRTMELWSLARRLKVFPGLDLTTIDGVLQVRSPGWAKPSAGSSDPGSIPPRSL